MLLQNPSVAISNAKAGGDSRIEAFSVHNDDAKDVDVFEYVSFDNIPDDLTNGVRWPDELFDEITKALASELNLIKSRLQEGSIMGERAVRAIDQHE